MHYRLARGTQRRTNSSKAVVLPGGRYAYKHFGHSLLLLIDNSSVVSYLDKHGYLIFLCLLTQQIFAWTEFYLSQVHPGKEEHGVDHLDRVISTELPLIPWVLSEIC